MDNTVSLLIGLGLMYIGLCGLLEAMTTRQKKTRQKPSILVPVSKVSLEPTGSAGKKKFPRLFAVHDAKTKKVLSYAHSIDTVFGMQYSLSMLADVESYVAFGPDHIEFYYYQQTNPGYEVKIYDDRQKIPYGY